MLNKLKELNLGLSFYSVNDDEFKKYGRVLDINTDEIVEACGKIELPNSGSVYEASVDALENLKSSEAFREVAMGGCKAQIGLCYGYNSLMNGLEFHKSSEINVAATDLVLLLGLEYEMEGNEFNSEKIKAFYLKKGDAVEVFSTSLHFCPCQVSDGGFSCVVVLPDETNTPLSAPSSDKLLFKKNKWLICHDKNEGLIERGVYPGIHGVNYEVKY